MEVDVGSLDGQGLEDSFQGGWRDGLDNLPAEPFEYVKMVQKAVCDGINGAGDLAAHALAGFVKVVGFEAQLRVKVRQEARA